MAFSDDDGRFMRLALDAAQETLKQDNIPIGAVLVIDGKLVGVNANRRGQNADYCSHAENVLVHIHAKELFQAHKQGKDVVVYSTLEPCLMCLGTIILNRIGRVVFACPDPAGGATTMSKDAMKPWYRRHWPVIDGPVLMKESYDMMIAYMDAHPEGWSKIRKEWDASLTPPE